MRKYLHIVAQDYLSRLGYIDENYNWKGKSPVEDWKNFTILVQIADLAQTLYEHIEEWEEPL